jgi:Uncharacterized protein conserved in bacteria
MKIESIKKMKSGKYKIKLDNNETLVTHDDVLIKNNILTNKVLLEKEYSKLLKDKEYFDVYNKAVKMIGTKFRSELEIKKYLDKTELEDNKKEEIILKLKNNGLINDKRFLKAYINDKINLSMDGPRLIFQNLKEYGIEENNIIEEIELIDKEVFREKLTKIINKKISNNTKYSKSILRKKVIDYAFSKGYEISFINEIINDFDIKDNESIKKDYEKIKNKLSKKYEGNELKYKIKEKLLIKGYISSDIEKEICEQ